MSDFNDPTPRPNDAATPGATATLDPPAGGGEGIDPLASLHRMSTTAGVTSQEYVAINIPSIVALVLALASVVAVLHSLLLVIPLAAVVTAVVALRQIRDSNGTQTGRGFAWLAIAVSLGIGGYKLATSVADRYQTQADRQAITARMEELGRLVRAGDYDGAYKVFSSRFQERINPQTFQARWEAVQSYSELGRITSLQWNRTNILFEDEPTSGVRVAYAAAWASFEKGREPARYTFNFRKSGSAWEIDDMPLLFPADRPARRPPR